MTHIRIENQVQESSICTLKPLERFHNFQNFELFPCDLSPPLKPAVGGFLKDHKMRHTHPNSTRSVAMGSRRQEEEMIKYPF